MEIFVKITSSIGKFEEQKFLGRHILQSISFVKVMRVFNVDWMKSSLAVSFMGPVSSCTCFEKGKGWYSVGLSW